MKVDFHVLNRDHLWREPLILDLRLRRLGIQDRMVFKHPISAGEDPHMPRFLDVYCFEGIPSFPPEIVTFRNGTLQIFPKLLKKVPNYYVNSCLRKNDMLISWMLWGPKKRYQFFLIQKSIFFHFSRKKAVERTFFNL